MVLVDADDGELVADCAGEPFPQEVEFIISALEAAPPPLLERQQVRRSRYRVRAALRLFSDAAERATRILFTRNVSPKAMAFLCEYALPLSHGGVLHVPTPGGALLSAACTILRCREAAPGWYEGAVYFNRPQTCFDHERMARA